MNPHEIFGCVDNAHRVLDIGQYNQYVSACGVCDSDERIEIFGRDCLGFGRPASPSGCLNKNLAVVYECPACFERQWSHSTLAGGYYTYLRYRKRQPVK